MARQSSFISSPGIKGTFGISFLSLGFLLLAHSAGQAQETYKWSVEYIIDNSQSVMDRPQDKYPRQNRGLAISPDGKFLYAAYLHSFNNSGEVRRIELGVPDYTDATVRVLQGVTAKAITVDPDGRVYLAESDQISIYDSHLREPQFAIDMPSCEGLAVVKEGGKIVLYASSRSRGTLVRWEIQTKDNRVVDAQAKGLGGEGELKLPEAQSLRGVAIDSKGRIWVADLAGNKIYRVEADGKKIDSKEIPSPMAMAFDKDRCFVTQSEEHQIAIFDLDLNYQGNLSVPWKDLELSAMGNNHLGGLAGIVMIPGKGFFVANPGGQTADQRSTYGKADGNSGIINEKPYTDTRLDDNEPILHAVLEAAPKP